MLIASCRTQSIQACVPVVLYKNSQFYVTGTNRIINKFYLIFLSHFAALKIPCSKDNLIRKNLDTRQEILFAALEGQHFSKCSEIQKFAELLSFL